MNARDCVSIRAWALPDARGYALLITTEDGERLLLACDSEWRVRELVTMLSPAEELDPATQAIVDGATLLQ